MPINEIGVIVLDVNKFSDERGWLSELFRNDEMGKDYTPVMSYMSITYAGQSRGPHEHKFQTDYFCFIGTSTFEVYLWDNRKESKNKSKQPTKILCKENEIKIIIVPPGIVHGYKNIGETNGIVINFPNKLYKGKHKLEEIDEIRYEDNSDEFTFQ